jgi:D-sedoheptulose 7-phosphate isomerase
MLLYIRRSLSDIINLSSNQLIHSAVYTNLIQQELQQAADVLNRFLRDPAIGTTIEQAAGLMAEAINRGNKIIACGNGGSHCDAMHFAEELSGRYRDNRRALPAIAISDVSHITCTANDYGIYSAGSWKA